MPEENNHLTFDALSPMQKGCVDCILDCESNGDRAAEWQGIGREDFPPDTLRRIAADCERFLKSISGGDPYFAGELFCDVDEYDFGWQFHLERQGTGVGFAELHIGQPLLSRLQMSAAALGAISVEIGNDGKVGFPASASPAIEPSRVVVYEALSPLQQGFADCCVEFESEGEFEDEWDGITVHHFSDEALVLIVEECRRFVQSIVGDDLEGWRALFRGIGDYDLGWYLYLERQRTGLGFRDVLTKGELRDRMLRAADELGSLTVEIGDDQKIHIVPHQKWASSPTN